MKWYKVCNRISLLLHALCSALGYFLIEMISRRSFSAAWTYMTTKPLVFAYNAALIFTTSLIVYLFRRRCFWRVLISILWLLLGIINGVILSNRVTPFTGPDLHLLTDGMAVLNKYLPAWGVVLALILLGLFALLLLILLIKAPKYKRKVKFRYDLLLVVVGAALFAGATQLALEKRVLSNYFGNIAFASFPIRVAFMKDVATIGIDTSGVSLHKRGYRQMTVKAPITETLASALIMLTPWNKDRILVDPFCGSGTFPIEAAMMAADMAPGMNRSFLAEDWKHLVPRKCWYDALEEAQDRVNLDIETDIQGYDIDPEALKAARSNAKMAGVDKLIHFQQRAVKDLSHPKPYGFIITNPPYGERLEEKEALPALYREIGESFRRLDKWSMYLITSYDHTENDIGKKADKNRKIYNGMLKTYYYQFLGPKPPKRRKDS